MTLPISTRSLVLLAAFCGLIFSGPIQHSRAADPVAAKTTKEEKGKLIIASATWGDLDDDDKSLDVTAKVAAMVKDNSLSVVADKSTLGNPPAGAASNKLKVGYTIDGFYRSKTVVAGQTLDISSRLIIRKAVYGKLPGGPLADVTDQIANLVAKNHLSVEASNENFGDSAEGSVKQLRVDYTFDGIPKSKTVGENEKLNIPEKAK